jgi:hypothetical protein
LDKFVIFLKVLLDDAREAFLKTLKLRKLVLLIRVEYLVKQIGDNLVFIELKVGLSGKIKCNQFFVKQKSIKKQPFQEKYNFLLGSI